MEGAGRMAAALHHRACGAPCNVFWADTTSHYRRVPWIDVDVAGRGKAAGRRVRAPDDELKIDPGCPVPLARLHWTLARLEWECTLGLHAWHLES